MRRVPCLFSHSTWTTMLIRSLLRLFAARTMPQPIVSETPNSVLLYAQFPPRSKKPAIPKGEGRKPKRSDANVGHRQRLLNMRLEHIRVCSVRRCQRLQKLGIITAGDLAYADCEKVASHFGAPRKALKVIQQYRRAIRFAASVPGMMPRDAMLLVSIHRRSVRGLASETASSLHRDLQRFSESSQGQAQLRGRRLPSARRLKRWIDQCESLTPDRTMRTRAA